MLCRHNGKLFLVFLRETFGVHVSINLFWVGDLVAHVLERVVFSMVSDEIEPLIIISFEYIFTLWRILHIISSGGLCAVPDAKWTAGLNGTGMVLHVLRAKTTRALRSRARCACRSLDRMSSFEIFCHFETELKKFEVMNPAVPKCILCPYPPLLIFFSIVTYLIWLATPSPGVMMWLKNVPKAKENIAWDSWLHHTFLFSPLQPLSSGGKMW